MNCSHCGNLLAPGSAFCAACGAATAAPAGGAGAAGGFQPGDGQAAQQENAFPATPPRRAQTAFYGRYGMRGGFVPPLPLPSSLTSSLPPDSAASMNAPQHAVVPDPASRSASPNTSSPSAPGTPADDQGIAISLPMIRKPRRPPTERLIVLVGIALLLALLVSLSVFGYSAYTKGQAATRATATAAARLNGTATAAAQATATASAPLLTDSLATDTNHWSDDGASTFFANGQYHLYDPSPTLTLDSYYQQQVFDNFRVQVTVTAYTDANPNADVPYAYGLILRADPTTPADKYAFFVSPAGTYDFARHDASGFSNNGWSDLSALPWASSSAIHTGKGATNTLMVIAQDTTFTLFINGRQVEVVTDTFGGYASGWIGLIVEGADMEAGFSNLQVYGPGA